VCFVYLSGSSLLHKRKHSTVGFSCKRLAALCFHSNRLWDTHSPFAIKADLSWWNPHNDWHPLPGTVGKENKTPLSSITTDTIVIIPTMSKHGAEIQQNRHGVFIFYQAEWMGRAEHLTMKMKTSEKPTWAAIIYLVNSKTCNNSYFSSPPSCKTEKHQHYVSRGQGLTV